MKKLLVVALSVVMVFAFAAFVNAATESFTGNVNAELDLIGNANYLANGYGDVWAEIDYTKDLTEGWSGGLKFRIKPGQTADVKVPVLDALGNPVDLDLDGVWDTTTTTVAGTGAVAYEGNGYIMYTADMYDVKLQTGGDFGAGDALNDGLKTTGKPNVLVNVKPMEGFTGTLYVNEAAKNFDLGLKGVYAVDPLTIGFGYVSSSANTTAVADDKTAMNIWGSYKIGDSLTVGIENATRTGNGNVNLGTAMMLKVGYTADALSANLKYYSKDAAFDMKTDKAAEESSLPDRFWDNTTGEGTLIIVDASYAISETVKVGGEVDLATVAGAFDGTNQDGVAVNDQTMGYKVYVTNQIVPNLKLEVAYQSFIDSKAYVKLSATL